MVCYSSGGKGEVLNTLIVLIGEARRTELSAQNTICIARGVYMASRLHTLIWCSHHILPRGREGGLVV